MAEASSVAPAAAAPSGGEFGGNGGGLPGVLSNGPDPADGFELDDGPAVGGALSGRDARGRFASVTAGEDPTGGAAGDGDAPGGRPGEVAGEGEPAAEPVEAPKPKTFKFAGQSYESQEKAEQSFRSFQGMFKPIREALGENPGDWAAKLAAVKDATRIQTERDSYVRAYEAWKANSESLAARIAELEGGEVQSSRGGAGSEPAKVAADSSAGLNVDTVLNGIDTDMFESIAVQAGLPAGGRYLAGEILKQVVDTIVPTLRAEFNQHLQPFQEESASRHTEATMAGVVEQVQALQRPDGGEAFPELKDPDALFQIGRVWRDSRLPAAHILTPAGLMQAIAMYRMVHGMTAAPAAPPTPAAPRALPVVSPSISSEPARNPAGAGRSPLSPEAQRIHRALDGVQFTDPVLGFARNR